MPISWKRTPLVLSALTLALSAQAAHAADAAATVAIDPATGKLRPVEHDDKLTTEAATQQRQAFGAAAKPASPLLQRMNEQAATARVQQQGTGMKSAMVNPKRYSYATATRNADGTLSAQCVQGEDAATHALHVQAAKSMLKKGGANVE